jgi:hypothetical protein
MRPPTLLIYFAVPTGLLIVWLFLLRLRWQTRSRARSVLFKFTLTLITCFYLFATLELLFYSVVTPSDGFGFTLAAQRWHERYWHPINSLDYRDREHPPAEFQNKEIIFVVGDSFVAGHGIRKVEDRFPDILQRNLGAQYSVINIARGGWNTTAEYEAMVSYPYKPKRIVLCYTLNDIDGAARKAGYLPAVLIEPPHSSTLLYIINNSYTLNFVYWRLCRFHNQDMGQKYWQALKDSYANPDIWNAHQAELNRIVEFSRSHDIDLTVVVFPNLAAIKDSARITSQVTDFFQSHNMRVLNLEPLLEGRDPLTLMVNSLDGHPNEALNKEVAELLTKEMRTRPGE